MIKRVSDVKRDIRNSLEILEEVGPTIHQLALIHCIAGPIEEGDALEVFRCVRSRTRETDENLQTLEGRLNDVDTLLFIAEMTDQIYLLRDLRVMIEHLHEHTEILSEVLTEHQYDAMLQDIRANYRDN